MKWKQLPPRKLIGLHEEVGTMDINGEELVLLQSVNRAAWWIRWRGRIWERSAAREAVDSFLEQNPPAESPETT